MKILAVDIGTGTQDILLFDSRLDVENSLKMVQPSPTMITHRRLKEATRLGRDVVLTGVTMGGGPSHWAAEDHLKSGYRLFATPSAARSFNDDLEFIQEMGVEIVSEDEVKVLDEAVIRIEMKDFDFSGIRQAFQFFDVSLDDLDFVAAAVFDHGAAPPGYSDRQFRFDYIAERIRQSPRLSSFGFMEEEIPIIMTRMQAVAASAKEVSAPLMLMDTAPAAVTGALLDGSVSGLAKLLVLNVGNFHTIAFRMSGRDIEGVFEHHTGMLDTAKLDCLLGKLADGSLTHTEIFEDRGHGALILDGKRDGIDPEAYQLVVTGPRRAIMDTSSRKPRFAAPYGDMMLAGCFGLVRAAADLVDTGGDEILAALAKSREKPPWEVG